MGRKGRNAAAAAGLAVTVVLAAGFLFVVVNRNSPPADPGAATSYSQVQWHATKVPATSSLSPYLAVSNGRLYMVTDVGQGSSHGPGLWSSADAVQWQQAPNPGMEPDFVARAAMADGNGGLVVVGELTATEATVPQIWHSTDGKTFAKAQVQLSAAAAAPASTSGQIVAVATASGQMVALGDHDVVDVTKGALEVRALDAWHSTDGSTWTHSELGGSDGYQATSMTAWSGGFAALATEPGKDTGYGVWLSSDGVAWHKAGTVATFGANSIITLSGRLVVVGSKQDAARGMVPASWSSADGGSWAEATAPVSGVGASFDAVAVVGSSVVAIGVSHVGGTGEPGGPSATPLALVPPTAWFSSEGSTWHVLGAAPAFQPYQTSMTAFDGHVVVATVTGTAEVTVSVGDLT
jgi:hypothetical protein